MLSFVATFTCVIRTHTFLRSYSWISNVIKCITWYFECRIPYRMTKDWNGSSDHGWESINWPRIDKNQVHIPHLQRQAMRSANNKMGAITNPTTIANPIHGLPPPVEGSWNCFEFCLFASKRFLLPPSCSIRKRKQNGPGCLNAIFFLVLKMWRTI